MAYFTGKTGKVSVNGTDLNVTNWTVEETADLSETSHSGSAGLKTFVVGLKGLTGTVDLNWDASVDLTTAPVVTAGTDIGTLLLYLEGSNGYIEIASALVNSATYTVPVDGQVTYSISFTATGPWDLTNIGTW